ncbi:MAG: hypothetical protein HIU84_00080 [Acidobacteria bacterium]|nr:hypothetical protein [Acidobacteriota bacterium]
MTRLCSIVGIDAFDVGVPPLWTTLATTRLDGLDEDAYRYNQVVMVLERVQDHLGCFAERNLSRPCHTEPSDLAWRQSLDARATKA